MAYVQTLFEKNFLEYASYVIKDRAIPHIDDGLKPVQRRILHSLMEMDDGKFHKVANVVGHCMKYHPHGDASIYEALVNLANKGLLIDTQGNFGNIYTGDPASAARYIEARALPVAKELLYRPELTVYEDSYDGRNKEPVTFPAKIPLVLFLGADGIAVGMSTRILPHNFIEILEAVKAELRGMSFQLFPDFPTGGIMDASGYADGLGKVLVRAKLDTSDPKRIVIRELPFGSTTETLIESIENAARRGKLKISGIQDFTTEFVEIEVTLARGVYTQDVVDALYAFTDCEQSISVNLLVIGDDNRPVEMTVTEVIKYHAKRLLALLKAELELDLKALEDKLHARTLERIFIEERIYKSIEQMTTAETVIQAVKDGFVPFAKEIKREVTTDDVERLLKIPIRRISLYDINKARKEMEEIKADIAKTKKSLADLVNYAIGFLETLISRETPRFPRKTIIERFDKVDVREAAVRNLTLRYDAGTGYIGYGVGDGKTATGAANTGGNGTSGHLSPPPGAKGAAARAAAGPQNIMQVSEFDRVLLIKSDGSYQVVNVPEKLFVGHNLAACILADKDELAKHTQTLVYRNPDGETYIKRCKIEQFILEKAYNLTPEGGKALWFTQHETGIIRLHYKNDPRKRIQQEEFPIADYLVKGVNAQGVRLAVRPVERLEHKNR